MADPVLPTSTNNVTTRKLAATIQGVWEKIDTKKADKVSQATNGNFASLDGNGNLADSGHKHSDYASSSQGGKADTAVQSVKMGSSSGTELKSGTNVVIPVAVATGTSGATSGVMTADDKKKLNGIKDGAEVNQNAFSKVVVGSTTIEADTKTDTLTLAQGTHITLTPSSADDKVTIATDLSSKSATSGGAEESLVTTGEKYTWNSKQDTVVWYDTYNASSNKGATKKTVDDAIAALDVSNITSNLGVSKTITALSETDGKIAASASPIQIAESQVTNLTSDLASKAPLDSPALTGTPTAPTATSGTNTTQIATTAFVIAEINDRLGGADALVYKGTITLGTTTPGAFTPAADKGWTYKVVANGSTKRGYVDGVAVEVGDMLICNTDGTAAATSSNYSAIAAKWDFIQTNLDGVVTGPASSTAASVAGFSDTTGKVIKQLTATEIKTAAGLDKVKNQAITVTSTSVSDGTNTFNKYVHPTTTAVSAAAVKVGNDTTGHVVLGDALTKSDVGLGNVVNTGDSATPVSGGTTKFTTGGAYTELNKKVDKVDGKGLSTNDYTTAEKTKLAGIAEGAEVNQNAFSNVKVGSTTVAADTKTDTVEFVGSGHVTITGDATNDKVTFATDLESKSAASGGTAVSLVTTGEKYTWNSKAAGNHTHSLSIEEDTGTAALTLGHNKKYKLTAGGSTFIFQTPTDNDTHRVVKVNGTQALANNTTALDLIPGSNVTITDGGSGKITIASTYSYTHPAYTTATAAAKKIGRDATGHVVIGDALTASDVGLGNVQNTKITVSATNGVKDETNNVTYKYTHPSTTAADAAAVKVGKDSSGHVVLGTALTKADVGLGLVANQTITVTSTSVSDGTNTFNKYTHPTTSGNKHIPSGGESGNLLGWSADGTAKWVANTSATRGQGYSATATNSSGTFAVTLSGYELVDGGIVSIKFSAAVPASAKLNINGKGAKSIYYRGSAIAANIIQANDTATFMYNSTSGVYHLLCVDRSAGEMTDSEVTAIIDALS